MVTEVFLACWDLFYSASRIPISSNIFVWSCFVFLLQPKQFTCTLLDSSDKLEDNKESFARCSHSLQILYIFILHNFSPWAEEKHWIRCYLFCHSYISIVNTNVLLFLGLPSLEILRSHLGGPGLWVAVVSRGWTSGGPFQPHSCCGSMRTRNSFWTGAVVFTDSFPHMSIDFVIFL